MRIVLLICSFLFTSTVLAKSDHDFKASTPAILSCSFFKLKGHELVEVKSSSNCSIVSSTEKRSFFMKGKL